MVDISTQLPEGFELDSPTQNIPEGFVLDEPVETPSINLNEEESIQNLPEGFVLDKSIEPMEFPEQDMDALDTDSTWIKNAAIIYKAEEGEDWKGSNKSLAEWFKDRHSKLNFNITSRS